MNELSAALRQFADRLDRGEALVGATQCAMVLGDDKGTVQATYIGRLVPASAAGVHLLAAGIQRFNADKVASQVAVNAPQAMFTNRGSTH